MMGLMAQLLYASRERGSACTMGERSLNMALFHLFRATSLTSQACDSEG